MPTCCAVGCSNNAKSGFKLYRLPVGSNTIPHHVDCPVRDYRHRQSSVFEEVHPGQADFPNYYSLRSAHVDILHSAGHHCEGLRDVTTPAAQNVVLHQVSVPAALRLSDPIRIPHAHLGKFLLQEVQLRQPVPFQRVHDHPLPLRAPQSDGLDLDRHEHEREQLAQDGGHLLERLRPQVHATRGGRLSDAAGGQAHRAHQVRRRRLPALLHHPLHLVPAAALRARQHGGQEQHPRQLHRGAGHHRLRAHLPHHRPAAPDPPLHGRPVEGPGEGGRTARRALHHQLPHQLRQGRHRARRAQQQLHLHLDHQPSQPDGAHPGAEGGERDEDGAVLVLPEEERGEGDQPRDRRPAGALPRRQEAEDEAGGRAERELRERLDHLRLGSGVDHHQGRFSQFRQDPGDGDRVRCDDVLSWKNRESAGAVREEPVPEPEHLDVDGRHAEHEALRAERGGRLQLPAAGGLQRQGVPQRALPPLGIRDRRPVHDVRAGRVPRGPRLRSRHLLHHHVRRHALRGPGPAALPGHLPGAGERRVHSGGGPLRQAHLPLPLARNAHQVDSPARTGSGRGRGAPAVVEGDGEHPAGYN
ncbi:hypothetical protein AVEN_11207-1 [Araneus ventricosus]|uniref:THAP-type domain-containing protein n=1 Tax=Araneus ventricosus TaxID=182803 RepID=A0A4Y2IUK2_ARAVE|nr:hypothetical protein AVEN_11207-1 [Araneus ventricosus]